MNMAEEVRHQYVCPVTDCIEMYAIELELDSALTVEKAVFQGIAAVHA